MANGSTPLASKSTSSPTELTQDDYKALLEELLAEIHRDGGQFTKLAGLKVSLEEGHKKVINMRKKLTSLMYGARK